MFHKNIKTWVLLPKYVSTLCKLADMTPIVTFSGQLRWFPSCGLLRKPGLPSSNCGFFSLIIFCLFILGFILTACAFVKCLNVFSLLLAKHRLRFSKQIHRHSQSFSFMHASTPVPFSVPNMSLTKPFHILNPSDF